jgi:hypothetical protein
MKRLTAIALIVVGVALPACAQRSASRGGFSGHSGSAFHGGFSASVPSRFASSPRYTGSRSLSTARGFQRGGVGNFSARPGYTGANRYRRPYRPTSRAGIPYVVAPWTGWVSPYIPGYPDDSDYGDSPVAPGDASGGYDGQPLEQDQPAPPDHYQPASDQSHLSPAPGSEDAVTLVFRDGRPPEQIHNYLLTRTTLYVLDQRHRVIPTDLLDLAATANVNHDAGINFQLPGTHK